MQRLTLALALFPLVAAAQDRFRQPQFPPDLIAEDSPIRDIGKLDKAHVRVESENRHMRVLRVRLNAGEALQTHDAREGLLVCLQTCSLTLTNPAGYVREIKLEAGRTMTLEALRNRWTNSGAATEFLYVETKRVVQ